MKKYNYIETGITLIALVVTIIILLILAGVTIEIAINGTGFFDKAKEARDKYQNSQENEEIQIAKYSNYIESYIGGGRTLPNIDFSTSEQDTGIKWINGEPIYQKTIKNLSIPVEWVATYFIASANNLDALIPDAADIIQAYGFVTTGEKKAYVPIVIEIDESNKWQIITHFNVWGTTNNITLLTLQYTKKTQTN